MDLYLVLVVVCSALVGGVIGWIFPISRPDATPEERKQDILRNLVPTSIGISSSFFMFPSGPTRWAVIASLVLAYAAIIAAGIVRSRRARSQ